MHELSIAISIVDGVLDEAQLRGGLNVEVVRVRVGRLSGVDKDALLFAYELARQDTPLASSTLQIEEVDPVILCPLCQREHKTDGSLFCPDCGSVTTRIMQGQELEITALEITA
jgi:hydrogenase nickel incorporation protein HypA/HybF